MSRMTELHSVFKEITNLSHIVIPNNITKIGCMTFFGCSSLANVFIPSSVKSLGDFCFYGCSSLKKIAIPSSVQSIGNHCFQGCSSLKKILIPSSVQSIGSHCFSECSSLIEISIPSSHISICKYSFYECTSLSKINIPPSVTSIDDHAFDGCTSLKQITIPTSVTKIGDYAFKSCTSLKRISISSSIKSIGNHVLSFSHVKNELCSDSDYMVGGIIPNDLCVLCLLYLSFIPLLCNFIISLVWWSKIHPWFTHGYKRGKNVYFSLYICWVSTLCVLVFLLIFTLLLFCVDKKKNIIIFRKSKKYYCKIKRKCYSIASLTFVALYLIQIISAIIASSYALTKKRIDGRSYKCMKYMIDGFDGAIKWVDNQSLKVQDSFQKWYSNMIHSAFKKNGEISNYYCLQKIVPCLIFAIISFLVSLITFNLVLGITQVEQPPTNFCT